MKKYIYIGLLVLVTSFCLYVHNAVKKTKYYKSLYERELQNVEAYATSNNSLKKEIREFKFTVDELQASKDSINKALLDVSKKLKVKDKNLKYLQYQSSVIHKTDTLILQDTVFRDRTLNVDTVLGDEWYNINLKLKYPSTIVTSPLFKSEKYVIVSNRKEYNSKPSKIFFIRWFQKKHWVTEVKVVEKNPYIDIKEQRFIEIQK